ncbi:MAG: cytochrome c [Burkholderiales bacterium]|nr:MAG: cytochrome c [Burkholderiales bacterium]
MSNQERSLSGCANGPWGSSATIVCMSQSPPPELPEPSRVPSRMWRAIIFMGIAAIGACSAPVAPRAQASGEAIAFGGGPGGPQDACFSCHGLKGEGDGPIPRLAGLQTGYLVKQLEDYAGHWRDEPSMTPIAKRMSDQDRLAVAVYYAALAEPMQAMEQSSTGGEMLFLRGDAERGLEACAVCHVEGGAKAGLATPVLAGQTAPYLRGQLIAFHESRRRNDPRDLMGQIARKLDKDEIEQLVSYIAALP